MNTRASGIAVRGTALAAAALAAGMVLLSREIRRRHTIPVAGGADGEPGQYAVAWKPRGHRMERVEPVTDGSLERAVWAAAALRSVGHREARPVRLTGEWHGPGVTR